MDDISLDPDRLAVLDLFEPAERREAVREVVATVETLIGELAELGSRTLETVRLTAHRGRNEAFALGARELGEAFAELEHFARIGHGEAVTRALEDVQAAWPPTRTAMIRLLE